MITWSLPRRILGALPLRSGTFLLAAAIGCGSGGSGTKTGSGGTVAGAGASGQGSGGTGTGGGGGGGIAGATAVTGGASPGGAGTAGAAGVGGTTDPLANCSWTLGTGMEVVGPPPTGNNSADLRGPSIGDVPFTASTMRRAVQVKVGTPVAGLQIGQAYLTRSSSTSEAVDLTIPVKNAGTDYPCFIEAKTLHYVNTGNTILNSPTDTDYLNGSVGDLGGNIYTHSCLAPGETGYFLDSQDTAGIPYFSTTATIEIDVTSPFPGMAPAGHLTPKQYDLGTCAGVRTVRVAAVNDSTSTITIAPSGVGLGPAILLDTDGLPAGWIYVEDDLTVQLASGEMAYFSSDLPGVPAVTRAQFFLDFDAPTTAALQAAQAPSDLTDALRGERANRANLRASWRAAAAAAQSVAPRGLAGSAR